MNTDKHFKISVCVQLNMVYYYNSNMVYYSGSMTAFYTLMLIYQTV